jgi:multidrug resistance protein MdtO
MTTLVETVAAPPKFLQWLRDELALQPGRLAAAARMALGSTVVAVIWMVFEIPLPAYAAYVVFLISNVESTSTLISAVGATIAITLAVALSIALYMLDAGEPALRLPLMALAIFGGMFLSRTISIGPIAFLTSFLVVMAQSLIDDVPNLEALTSLVLWLWVIVMVPLVLTAVSNLLFSQDAAQASRAVASRAFRCLAEALRQPQATPLDDLRRQLAALVELRGKVNIVRHDLRGITALDLRLIDSLDELASLVAALPAGVPAAAREALAAAAQACGQAFDAQQAPALPDRATLAKVDLVDERARPVVAAIANVLTRIAEGLALRLQVPAASPPRPTPRSLLVPDAFSNPDHVRFALKTTIAAMAAYMLYTALDWPGIRTSLVTCFFVALATTGESLHKLSLRLGGAIIGAALGVLSLVFLIPHMSDIGDLALLVFVFSAAAAWLATGSDLIAYAGLQMAFAFYVGLLQGLQPPTETTVLRDRIMGILIGNVLITVVFSTFWPVSSLASARAAVTAVYRALGQRLLQAGSSLSQILSARIDVASTLSKARRLLTISAYESRTLGRIESEASPEGRILENVSAVETAAWIALNQAPREDEAEAVQGANRAIGQWLTDHAPELAKGKVDRDALAQINALASPAASDQARSSVQAPRSLASIIARAASDAA